MLIYYRIGLEIGIILLNSHAHGFVSIYNIREDITSSLVILLCNILSGFVFSKQAIIVV